MKTSRKARVSLVIALVLLAVAVVLMVLAIKRAEERPELAPNEEKRIAVSVEVLAPTSLIHYADISATLMPWHDATVAAETDGRVTALAVDRGDAVVKGQPLLNVDDRLQKAMLARARITLRDAERELARYKPLLKEGAVSEKTLTDLETAEALAQTAFDEAKVRLSCCSLDAPWRGDVQQRFVELGQYVRTGDPVFRLVDISRLRLVVHVPEQDVNLVEGTDALQFTLPGDESETYEGELIFVAPQSDLQSNTYRCELEVQNEAGSLRGGMLVSLKYPRQKLKDALSVPLDALIAEKGKFYAYVAKEGCASRRTVRIVSVYGTRAVVRDGLSGGDRLIVLGQRLVSDGTAIEVLGD